MLVFFTAGNRYNSLLIQILQLRYKIYHAGDLFLVQFVRFVGQAEVVSLEGDEALLRDFEPCFFIELKKQHQFHCQKVKKYFVKKYSVRVEVSFPAAENFPRLYYLLVKDEHYFQTIHQAECQLEEFHRFYQY